MSPFDPLANGETNRREAMAGFFAEVINSGIFTFFVGEKKVPIVAHSAAIAKQSQALNKLINGPMAEGRTKSAILDDICEEDFIRFCQFAYTGDYSIPPHTIEVLDEAQIPEDVYEEECLPECEECPQECEADEIAPCEQEEEVPIEEPIQCEADDLWLPSWGRKAGGRRVTPSFSSMKPTLQLEWKYSFSCPILPRQALLESCEVITNEERNQVYTRVFLAHARLYVVADKYGVESLKHLTLHKLHKTLSGFTLHKARIGDVVELVRYTYSDEHTQDNGNDPLRRLVSQYIACELDIIGGSKEFFSLMEEGGPFVRDIWAIIQRTLL